MSLEAKKRLVRVLIAFFALWPVAQYTLTRTHGVNPWKLFALGMYSIPEYRQDVLFRGVKDGEVAGVSTEGNPKLGVALNDFVRRRWALGRLAPPDGVAARILEAHPEFDAVRIEIRRKAVNLRTGRVEEERTSYEIGR